MFSGSSLSIGANSVLSANTVGGGGTSTGGVACVIASNVTLGTGVVLQHSAGKDGTVFWVEAAGRVTAAE